MDICLQDISQKISFNSLGIIVLYILFIRHAVTWKLKKFTAKASILLELFKYRFLRPHTVLCKKCKYMFSR